MKLPRECVEKMGAENIPLNFKGAQILDCG